MNVRSVFAVVTILGACLFAIACGGSNAGVGDSSASADSPTLKATYERIEAALDASYVELGKPAVDWDNLDRVQGHAFESLTSDSANNISGSSWSVSVAPDHIVIWVSADGAEKRGEWRP